MPVPAKPASTVVVIRPATQGFQVFLVERHHLNPFLPRAWVFPGGRVDDTDALASHPRVRGGQAISAQLALAPAQATAYLIAAARETFEEAGIWLGTGSLPSASREALRTRTTTLAQLLDTHRASLDLDCLGYWSWWITPETESHRFDTRFFVAVVTAQQGHHDGVETVNSRWLTPKQALALADEGQLPLAPPTWWTLSELARYTTTAQVQGACPHRPNLAVRPLLRVSGTALTLTLPGHPGHPDAGWPNMPIAMGRRDGRWWVTSTA